MHVGLLLLSLFWLSSCATVDEGGRIYFRLGNKINGVEPADALIERMQRD